MANAHEIEQFADAVEIGDLETVQKMVEAEPGLISEQIWCEDQALHLACWQNHLNIIRFLIARGANVNVHGDLGRTPLHYAVYEGDKRSRDVAAILIAAGAEVDSGDTYGSTPLEYAASQQNKELGPCIDLLLQQGARMTLFAGLLLVKDDEYATLIEKDAGATSTDKLEELATLAESLGHLRHLALLHWELARRRKGE
ncbi:MAG TPA: ankyrin repeat domain-containing protein [Tepidisphaeraceae bacterium]|jgi:ankyrin repeat protein|nr:ankyrin repeat domain-containing protein [Tepidisphaeraceae bacterium]